MLPSPIRRSATWSRTRRRRCRRWCAPRSNWPGRDHPRRQEGPHRQRLLHPGAGGAVLLHVLFLLLPRRAARHLAVAVGGLPDRVRHHGRSSPRCWRCSAISRCAASAGPQKTIESVKETREALTPGHDKAKALSVVRTAKAAAQPDRGPVGLVMAPPDPSVVRIDGPWRHLEVHANGIRFHVVEAEPKADDIRVSR